MDRKRNRRLMEESIRQGKPMQRSPLKPRSKKRQAKDRLLAKVKRQLWARCHGHCEVPWCNQQANDAHHVIKRSQGGSHALDNVLALCRRCHDSTDYPSASGHRLVIEPVTGQRGFYFRFYLPCHPVLMIGPFPLEA